MKVGDMYISYMGVGGWFYDIRIKIRILELTADMGLEGTERLHMHEMLRSDSLVFLFIYFLGG